MWPWIEFKRSWALNPCLIKQADKFLCDLGAIPMICARQNKGEPEARCLHLEYITYSKAWRTSSVSFSPFINRLSNWQTSTPQNQENQTQQPVQVLISLAGTCWIISGIVAYLFLSLGNTSFHLGLQIPLASNTYPLSSKAACNHSQRCNFTS